MVVYTVILGFDCISSYSTFFPMVRSHLGQCMKWYRGRKPFLASGLDPQLPHGPFWKTGPPIYQSPDIIMATSKGLTAKGLTCFVLLQAWFEFKPHLQVGIFPDWGLPGTAELRSSLSALISDWPCLWAPLLKEQLRAPFILLIAPL